MSKTGLTELKIKALAMQYHFGGFRGESFSLTFPVSRGCLCFLVHGLLPSSKSANAFLGSSIISLSLMLTLPPPSLTCEDHDDYTGPTPKFQEHLPLLKCFM